MAASEPAAAGTCAGMTTEGIGMLVPTLLEVDSKAQKRQVSRRQSAAM